MSFSRVGSPEGQRDGWVIRCARRSWENRALCWSKKAQGRFHCFLHLLEVCGDRIKRNGYKLKHRIFQRDIRKYVLMWGCPKIGTGCPMRLCSLHPWRYSELYWTSSWATCSNETSFGLEVGPDDLQGSLATWVILWFHEKHTLDGLRARHTYLKADISRLSHWIISRCLAAISTGLGLTKQISNHFEANRNLPGIKFGDNVWISKTVEKTVQRMWQMWNNLDHLVTCSHPNEIYLNAA